MLLFLLQPNIHTPHYEHHTTVAFFKEKQQGKADAVVMIIIKYKTVAAAFANAYESQFLVSLTVEQYFQKQIWQIMSIKHRDNNLKHK